MTPQQVYMQFKEIFPNYISEGITYYPNGRNCIRIRGIKQLHPAEQDYVFHFYGPNDWRFETFKSFFKQMKGENSNG